MQTKKRILISVTDKTGIGKFKRLTDTGKWEIISTGGTATKLQELGVSCIPIEDITHFPEMMDGRLKTIHPNIFGGILANRSIPDHIISMAAHNIELIDIVAVNLYAFESDPCIEKIDIGGPSLLRACAKNGAHAVPIIDPADYDLVISQIMNQGSVSMPIKEKMAVKVFEHTSKYDAAIAKWMHEKKTNFLC